MTVVRPTRNRDETAARILGAVGGVLARDGFQALGVNHIAKEAGVDKVLIYRYFGGLPGLIAAWGASGRFWPDLAELLGPDGGASLRRLPLAERYERFFCHFIDGLRQRPLTIEILAAEIAQRSELMAVLEEERERWGEQAFAMLAGPDMAAQAPELRDITLLLVAGVQHLLLRGRTISRFGDLDLRSDADWARLKASIAQMARRLLAGVAVA
jgi:AcrR family transcriptional regulator